MGTQFKVQSWKKEMTFVDLFNSWQLRRMLDNNSAAAKPSFSMTLSTWKKQNNERDSCDVIICIRYCDLVVTLTVFKRYIHRNLCASKRLYWMKYQIYSHSQNLYHFFLTNNYIYHLSLKTLYCYFCVTFQIFRKH